MAVKKAKAAGPKVIKSSMTLVRFMRHGRRAELVIRPANQNDDSSEGVITIEAPCGDSLTLPKTVAIAAANAVLEVAASL